MISFKNNRILPSIVAFSIVSLFVCLYLFVTSEIAFAAADGTESKFFANFGHWIGHIILSIAAGFTWLGGSLLDWSIKDLVLGMGGKINNERIGVSINATWKVIRDFCNLAFIFGFIYIGIKTILDYESSKTKSMLASIIIGALLINFSLFFTKVVIDASNILAIEIHKTMLVEDKGIGLSFAEQLGIVSLYSPSEAEKFVRTTDFGSITFYILGAIFLMVAGFVFAAGAFLLIIRFVALVLIMVFSPILFAATVFPQTSKYASDLWSKLISYAFFAPVYLFFILTSFKLIQGTFSIGGDNTFSQAFTGKQVAFGVVLNFVIVIMFLIFSLIAAQKIGIAGASQTIKFGNMLRSKIPGAIGGAIGRNTIGRLGNYTNEKQEELRKSSRRSDQLKAFALRATGVNAASGAAAKAKYGSSQSRVDVKKQEKEIDRARSTDAQVRKISDSVKSGSIAPAGMAGDAARIQMEKELSAASTEQMLSLVKEYKEKSPEYKSIVANMSSNQFDSIMKSKSEDFDDKQKETLRAARSIAVQDRLIETENRKRVAAAPAGAPPPPAATISDAIGKADGKDLDALDFNTVYNNAGQLSSKQLDDMTLTVTAKARLKEKRQADLETEFAGGAGAATLYGRIKNDTERSKLPNSILTNAASAAHLNTNVLTKILDNDGIDAVARATIKRNVIAHHGGVAAPASRPFMRFFSTPLGSRY